MKTIKIPLVYKEGTKLIQYPEDPELFKECVVVGSELACKYYGEVSTYASYAWPETAKADVILSRYDFMQLVGVDNMVAIKTASKSSVDVEVFVLLIENADEVNLSEPTLIDGLAFLVAGEVITQEESERILQG